jgi:hypothetical protein
LRLLLQGVLLNVVTDSGSHKQRNKRAFSVLTKLYYLVQSGGLA